MENEGRNKTAKPLRALQTVEKRKLGSSYGQCCWSPELVLFVPRATCNPWGKSSNTRPVLMVISVLLLTGSARWERVLRLLDGGGVKENEDGGGL